MAETLESLERHDAFVRRHIGPDAAEQATMLAAVGFESLDALVSAAAPVNPSASCRSP